MTNKNLIIIAGAVLIAIVIMTMSVDTSKFKQAENLEPNTQLTIPNDTSNKPSKPSSVPSQVEKGTSLNPNMPKLEKPEMSIDTNKDYKAVIVTSKGTIKMDLLEKTAPNTVNNFVYLANNQLYNGLIFHRVIKDFMIQGGDPAGDGTGGPGYTIEDEPFEGEYTRGTVAMARTMAPNSSGSQFFIMHKDTPIAKTYLIFGQVTEGMDVVDAIAETETDMSDRPLNPITIESVEIIVE